MFVFLWCLLFCLLADPAYRFGSGPADQPAYAKSCLPEKYPHRRGKRPGSRVRRGNSLFHDDFEMGVARGILLYPPTRRLVPGIDPGMATDRGWGFRQEISRTTVKIK